MLFDYITHPSPTPEAERLAAIADPGFGKCFSDHMVVIDYDEAKGGWHSATLGPRQVYLTLLTVASNADCPLDIFLRDILSVD